MLRGETLLIRIWWRQIFGDKTLTIEDLMRDQGQLVKKGTLSENGDLEFWDDGTTTTRAKSVESKGEQVKGIEGE